MIRTKLCELVGIEYRGGLGGRVEGSASEIADLALGSMYPRSPDGGASSRRCLEVKPTLSMPISWAMDTISSFRFTISVLHDLIAGLA